MSICVVNTGNTKNIADKVIDLQNEKKNLVLGILGGLGPMATVYFYEMLTEHTKAEKDQDHIDIIISSRATTPDRTAFVLGKSEENPLCVMKSEAEKLTDAGAELISIPCNTAHYFYDELAKSVTVPIVNIIYETLSYIKRTGAKKIGVLATDGTIMSGAYEQMCKKMGIGYEVPSPERQKMLSEIIYSEIKQGKDADMRKFGEICDELLARGCEKLVLGCTELSLIARKNDLGAEFVDSLQVLAARTIRLCGKETVGFGKDFMKYID